MGRNPHDDPAPSVDAYRERLATHLAGLTDQTGREPEHVALSDCAGRVTAEPVPAPVDLPLFRNSQMDGYAVRAAEIAAASATQPTLLPVTRVIAAGHPPGPPLEPGSAVKIMTGAPLPDGADCVIPVEDTTAASPRGVDASDERVAVHAPRPTGAFVRTPGDDVRAGDRVLEPGTRLGARQLAAAASLGLATLVVRPRPRVAILSTGAELVAPGTTPGPGAIWDANSVALATAVHEAGGVVTLSTVTDDDPATFTAHLDEATRDSDLVLTSGAVSMGDFEVVRDTLEPTDGAWFGHIAMQPGGPQGLATWSHVPVVCLPGNPVSVLVSFVVLLRGLLRHAAGIVTDPDTRPRDLHLADEVTSPAGRTQFRRVTITDNIATPLSGPGSHLIATMGRADGLAEIPADTTHVAAGHPVRVWPL